MAIPRWLIASATLGWDSHRHFNHSAEGTGSLNVRCKSCLIGLPQTSHSPCTLNPVLVSSKACGPCRSVGTRAPGHASRKGLDRRYSGYRAPDMTKEEHEAHLVRFRSDPIYRFGYLAGLAGASPAGHYDVALERVAWADGWLAGSTEALNKGDGIAAWMAEGRLRVDIASSLDRPRSTGE